MNLIVPPVQPRAAGVKVTLSSTLCPGAKVSGRLRDDGVNQELFALTAEIVALDSPVLVRVTGNVSV